MNNSPTDSPLDIAAIRARCDAATEEPWELDYSGCVRAVVDDCKWGPDIIGMAVGIADGDFIAHARTDVPALCDALSTAIAERRAAEEVIEDCRRELGLQEGESLIQVCESLHSQLSTSQERVRELETERDANE